MSIKKYVSLPEWQARCELAALYRVIAHYKMTDLIDTHISLRIPDQYDHFLINQYGVAFDKMTASTLVKIDHEGQIVCSYEQNKPVNQAGFVIHSAIHHARPEIDCVIHTHTANGIAVSAQQHGLLPISQHALKFYQQLAYHEYEGVALSTDERERLVADLGDKRAMLLRNHGLLAMGESIARAFHEIYFLERACQAQIKALSGGVALHYPTQDICEKTAQQFASPLLEPILQRAWQAALSLVADQQEAYSQ